MNNAEEATKIAKDVRFAVLGRAIADVSRAGGSYRQHVAEATLLRQQEQDSADKQTRFAALTRQIGDAARNGHDITPMVEMLTELRSVELGPPREAEGGHRGM
jgi:hypothetical protein